jgi:hypothetical protein
MKNCIGVLGLSLQHFDSFGGGQDKQFDLLARGVALDFPHYGQSAVGTAADDELPAFPRNLFFYRERRVAKLLLKFLGWLLLALTNFAAVNDNIVFVNGAVDLDGAERKAVEMHTQLLGHCLGALLRRESNEGGPALLDFHAATTLAEDFPFFVIDQRLDLGKVFLAIAADKLVVGHSDLAQDTLMK